MRLDNDDLDRRAGRHGGSYAHPGEAVGQLIAGVVDPFITAMKRQRELGLAAEALETCKGLLVGLYGVRNAKGHEVLGWAPDFAWDMAGNVVATWAGVTGARRSQCAGQPALAPLLASFVDDETPDWSDLISRVLERG